MEVRPGGQVVQLTAVIKTVFSRSALIGAALAVICGWLLWLAPFGEPWVNASYDSLFRFGHRAVTNQIVFLRLDNESYEKMEQHRGVPWDRTLHTRLLNRLTADGARLVVFDALFQDTNNPVTDAKFAAAMRRNGKVVLAAFVKDDSNPQRPGYELEQPDPLFRDAAAGWGVGQTDAPTGQIDRRHWPFYRPGEGEFHSLGWSAAQVYSAQFDTNAETQWLHYYGENGPGTVLPYHQAFDQSPGFFSGKVVFIGSWPERPGDPGYPEKDKFLTPYTHWNGQAVGGVEIMATTFLNLVRGDWLRRPPAWMEFLLLAFSGTLFGGGLCQFKPLGSLLVAAGIFFVVTIVFVTWSYFSNYWFPWLLIAGGQVPMALAWAWAVRARQITFFPVRFPGYQTVGEPFGEGSYGRVWLARNATGELQALKEITRAKFSDNGPYDREFRGIKSYKPFSNQHPGLLHIEHVNRNEGEGYFYYVMELGDALDLGWEQRGESFRPRDLASVCDAAPGGRLPVGECLRIGIGLLDALDFLHQHGLVHRDIKPSNVIFVNDRPKLADVGLVRNISPDSTLVGTPGYMPPPPEPPGTKAADIYAMGKLLYVISTGKNVNSFSELSTTLVQRPEFMRLNEIICQACQPAADQRFASAAAMLKALRFAQDELGGGRTQVV